MQMIRSAVEEQQTTGTVRLVQGLLCLSTRKKKILYLRKYMSVNITENYHLDSEPQRGDKSLKLVVLIDLLRRTPLDVEDLASKRKDRLLKK